MSILLIFRKKEVVVGKKEKIINCNAIADCICAIALRYVSVTAVCLTVIYEFDQCWIHAFLHIVLSSSVCQYVWEYNVICDNYFSEMLWISLNSLALPWKHSWHYVMIQSRMLEWWPTSA